YKYGGHAVLMRKSACEWMDTKYFLSYFGKTVSKARGQYNSYVKEGADTCLRAFAVVRPMVRQMLLWIREAAVAEGVIAPAATVAAL
ncbi:MAG: hypothetical protein KKD33_10250, partial [Verrucomicrobia bacterium]|nr:hypothetical protein [Verrucomicrobiota bacterium]